MPHLHKALSLCAIFKLLNMKHFNSLLILTFFAVSFGQVNAQTYFESNKKCSEILKDIPIGDSIFWVRLGQRDSCLIGLKAPSVSVTTITNERIKTENLNGKVIFLNFWFTRCQPCIKEMPTLNEIVKKYKTKNVEFISFANEDSGKLKEFLKSNKFHFKIVPSAGHILIETFKLFAAWPTSIIIDRNGIIRLIRNGVIEQGETIELLDSLLK